MLTLSNFSNLIPVYFSQLIPLYLILVFDNAQTLQIILIIIFLFQTKLLKKVTSMFIVIIQYKA